VKLFKENMLGSNFFFLQTKQKKWLGVSYLLVTRAAAAWLGGWSSRAHVKLDGGGRKD
jgi:hypothetical protein